MGAILSALRPMRTPLSAAYLAATMIALYRMQSLGALKFAADSVWRMLMSSHLSGMAAGLLFYHLFRDNKTLRKTQAKLKDAQSQLKKLKGVEISTQTPMAFETASKIPALARGRSSSGVFGVTSLEVIDFDEKTDDVRKNSLSMLKEQIKGKNLKEAVIVVDPVSSGANLAHELLSRGYNVVRVFGEFVPEALKELHDPELKQNFCATFSHDSADPMSTLESLWKLPYKITTVFAGSELGVELSDWLSESLDCPTNGTEHAVVRRDKYYMGEAVRKSATRAVLQARVSNVEDISKFLKTLPKPLKCVIKPIRSAGSEDVFICTSEKDVKEKYAKIIGKVNALGTTNVAVVCQEFLEGTEYVVDTVSRDGQHKLCAIWEYDKRAVNGAPFVYFGQKSVSGDSPLGKQLFEYQKRVLDALGIRWGPGHGEVMYNHKTKTPCLVEVGARPHGAEGIWQCLARKVYGYDQVQMCVDAYLNKKNWDKYPEYAVAKGYGVVNDLVSFHEGTLVEYNKKAKQEIENLSTFVKPHFWKKPGQKLHKTVDMFTQCGSLSLFHKERSVVEKERLIIFKHQKSKNGLWILK